MHLILWDQQGPISATPHTLCEEITWGVLTSLLFFSTDPLSKSSNWLNGDYLSEMPLAFKESILQQINILFFLKINSWGEPNDGMVIFQSWLFLTPSHNLLRHAGAQLFFIYEIKVIKERDSVLTYIYYISIIWWKCTKNDKNFINNLFLKKKKMSLEEDISFFL